MLMPAIFHFAPLRLGAGSLIQPGNFGRIVKRYVVSANDALGGWRLARELIFESARPDGKPSRSSACFALPTRDDANKYRQFNDPNFIQVLHEVEIVDPSQPQHIAGLSWTDLPASGPVLDPMRFQATNYWNGVPGTLEKGSELVTASALRVVTCLE
jgi:hypothetical protein